MLASLLTALLFATSTVCAYRTARQMGGIEANFWRITLATMLLAVWAVTFGDGLAGAPGWFMLSGLCGIGLGDTAYFQGLPRLGSRRTALVVQCFTAPFAALIEWLWLDARLTPLEIVCIGVILLGVAIALAPEDHLKISRRDWKIGLIASLLSAVAGAVSAVIIRRGYAELQAMSLTVDAGTTGYQRMLGGFAIPAVALFIVRRRSVCTHGGWREPNTWRVSRDKWARLWPWVLGNAVAGQTLGVSCMQWALKTTPAGIVAAIIATTPLLLLPLTRLVEKEKIGLRATLGASVGVGGVIGLILLR